MGKPKGIIYGTLELFSQSSANRNGRLITIAFFLTFVLPLILIFSIMTAAGLGSSKSSPNWVIHAAQHYILITAVVFFITPITGMILLIFIGARMVITHHRPRSIANPPAPNLDAKSESD